MASQSKCFENHQQLSGAVSVAIVGAGVAGLRAAEALLDANKAQKCKVNYKVTVFEARNRLGGRVETSNEHGWEGPGGSVDLGPNWIHGTHENPLMGLLTLTQPESVIYAPYSEGGTEVVHVLPSPISGTHGRNQKLASEVFDAVTAAIARAEAYSLRYTYEVDKRWSLKDYLRVAAGEKYLNSRNGYSGTIFQREGEEDEEWKGERRRVRDFERTWMVDNVKCAASESSAVGEVQRVKIHERAGLNGVYEEENNVMVSGEEKYKLFMQMSEFWGTWVGEELGRQSLRWFIMEEAMEGSQGFLASTYGPVLGLLSRPLQDGISAGSASLQLNTLVTSISIAPPSSVCQKILIKTVPTSTHTLTSTPNASTPATQHIFDAVILAIPLGTLKCVHHTFFPAPPSPLALPPRAVDAVKGLGYGRLEKVYLRFERAWWGKEVVLMCFLANSGIENCGIEDIPSIPHLTSFSLAAMPEPYAQPTLLFYLFGETAASLVRKLNTLSDSGTEPVDSTTGKAGRKYALERDTKGFNLLLQFFRPYLARLYTATAVQRDEKTATEGVLQPTRILYTSWSSDPLAGYGSYTQFPVGCEDTQGDVRILRSLGGRRGDYGRRYEGENDDEGAEVPGERAWDNLPVWLAGEFAATRKGLGTVAGAWWSGAEKGRRARQWFEGEEEMERE